MASPSGCTDNPWFQFARHMSGVSLSDEAGSVAPSVRAQVATVRAIELDWRDVPVVECLRVEPREDGASVGPMEPDQPVRPAASLVPLADVFENPEHFGFVEVTSPVFDTAEPNGSLAGLRFARKDMLFRAGELNECGSPVMKGYRPTVTASALSALDAAGARDIGRLHMAELALSPTGRNNWLGPGRNPWDRTRASGGSSSGSGIAAATRAVDFTIGSDTGGSVRIPASACGVTGLKPTQGVLPLDGVMPLSPTLDCLGLLAPGADTIAAAFEALLAGGGGSRLGPEAMPSVSTVYVPDLGSADDVAPVVVESVRSVAAALESAGYRLAQCRVPKLDVLGQLASVITSVEAASVWADFLSADPDQFYREIRRRIERGALVPGPVYLRALRLRRSMLRSFVDDYLPQGGMLLLPTTPSEAPTIESTLSGTPDDLEAALARFSYWTRGINYLGLPAVSVPAGFGPEGTPLGVQIVGRPYEDRSIVRAARAVQEHTEWHRQAPPLMRRGE